nr:hypothetical protein [Tanacetum cinerariifolium]
MDTTIEQQLAMDEALVPTAQRLKIGRSNFQFLSDIKSKESTLQLVYDVLRRCPFFNAFLVIADVPKIYMQEFWATSTVHYHSIRFKMDTKKHIIDLESFRDILHICPRVPGQLFADPPFEEEILAIIRFLRHSAAIRTLTDILWGLYHKRNIDYAYLMWEDFVYQVEHKNQKKRNEMYYPRCTKAIIHHFMSKESLIPRRNKVNWHYVRNDFMFSMIKLVSRYQNAQQFGVILPIELMNDEIRNSKAYKEYYAIATGKAAPKRKASVRRTRSSSDTSITPPTAAASPRPKAYAKENKQQKRLKPKRHISQPSGFGADEGTGDDNKGKDDDGDEEDEGDDGEEGNGNDDDDEDDDGNEGDDDDAAQEVIKDDDKDDDEEDSEDESDGEKDLSLNICKEERHDEEEEEDELYRDNPTSVAPLPITTPTMTSSTIATLTQTSQALTLPTTILSKVIQHLLSFGSLFCFDDRLRSLEQNFSEVMQTNQFTGAVSAIPKIVQHYMDRRMNEAVQVAVQLQSDWLREEAQRENDEFLIIVDENIKKIIREQVKEQVKAQVSKILPRIEQDVNEQLEAEVLTRSSYSSRTSYDMNKRNLYKALVDANESDKIILDTYGETVTQKRRRNDDEDKDEEPTAEPDRGSKRRREGKEPESAGTPSETATKSAGRLPRRWKSPPIRSLKQVIPKGQQYPHNLLQPLPLIPNNRGRCVIPFVRFINNDLEYLRGGASSQKYTTSVTKMKAADYGHIKWIEDYVLSTMWIHEPIIYDKHALWGVSHWGRKRQQFYGFAVNLESARDVYSKRRIIAVTKLKIMEWHSYKYLDWITNKDKKNRLMRINELHKFSDETFTDVRTALDDRLKGIRMRYLPQTIWRKGDKDRSTAMIQAIDKKVKTRRIMWSLESFGTPHAIISDRGTHFCNDQFAKVMLKYDVTHRLATTYHLRLVRKWKSPIVVEKESWKGL